MAAGEEVGVHRSAAVFLVGRAPPSVPSEYLGEYERKGVFGGRHLYVRKGDRARRSRTTSRRASGASGRRRAPCSPTLEDVLSVYDDALRPDNVSAPWKAATGTAKGLRVLSGDVGRLALRAHAAFDALVYALTPGHPPRLARRRAAARAPPRALLRRGADHRRRARPPGTVLGRGEVGLLAPLPV